jgi:hypothetical protein
MLQEESTDVSDTGVWSKYPNVLCSGQLQTPLGHVRQTRLAKTAWLPSAIRSLVYCEQNPCSLRRNNHCRKPPYHIRTLTRYMVFDIWQHLVDLIIRRLELDSKPEPRCKLDTG